MSTRSYFHGQTEEISPISGKQIQPVFAKRCHFGRPRTFVLWLSQQCLGIVQGLHGIHDVKIDRDQKSAEEARRCGRSPSRRARG